MHGDSIVSPHFVNDGRLNCQTNHKSADVASTNQKGLNNEYTDDDDDDEDYSQLRWYEVKHVLFCKRFTASKNYGPITCVSTTWKLLSGNVADKIMSHLETNDSRPVDERDQAWQQRNQRPTTIDKTVTSDSKKWRTNVSMDGLTIQRPITQVHVGGCFRH